MILPAARQVNGRAVEHMVRAGAFIGEADGYFKRMAARIVDGECGRETNGREANEANGGDAGTAAAAGMTVAGETPEIRLSGETLLAQEPIAAAYVLREAVSRAGGSLRDFGAVHIGLLMELARRRTGASIDLPGGLRRALFFAGDRENARAGNWDGAGEGDRKSADVPGAYFFRLSP